MFVSPQKPPEMAKTRWCGNRRKLVRKHIVTRGGGGRGEILVGCDNLFLSFSSSQIFLAGSACSPLSSDDFQNFLL